MELPPLAVAYQSTNGLFVNAKEAVRQLFEQKRKEICSSPERADLKLSHEEALGWLLAHARGRRLLVEEARPIGKAAGEQATAVKKQLDAVRDAAKSKPTRRRWASAQRGGSDVVAGWQRARADGHALRRRSRRRRRRRAGSADTSRAVMLCQAKKMGEYVSAVVLIRVPCGGMVSCVSSMMSELSLVSFPPPGGAFLTPRFVPSPVLAGKGMWRGSRSSGYHGRLSGAD